MQAGATQNSVWNFEESVSSKNVWTGVRFISISYIDDPRHNRSSF